MKRNLLKATKLIKDGKLIIAPTDTVYGLLCRYDSEESVKNIYDLKKRDGRKPLILLGYSYRVLKKFIASSALKNLCSKELKKIWPGATTLVVKASDKAPPYLNSGFDTIGIRVPNNPFLLELLKECPDGVVASTSANLSGKSHLKPQKAIINGVELFIEAKKGEMSLQPSEIIHISGKKRTKLR